MRHAVLAHGNLDLHARVVDFTQHLGDAAHGLAKQRGRLGQLDHHDLSRLGGACSAFGDQHILAVALVLRRHQPDTAFLQQAADDGLWRALDDFDHAAFGPATAVLAHDAHTHAVLVQDGAHFIRGNIDIAFAIVADDETVSITVPLHAAFDLLRQMWSGLRAGGGFFVIQS